MSMYGGAQNVPRYPQMNLAQKVQQQQHQSVNHNNYAFANGSQSLASPASVGSSQALSMSAGGNGSSNGGNNGSNAGSAAASAHWQEQLAAAQISRQSSSPHHHARTAAALARGTTSQAVTITDPNNPRRAPINGLHRRDDTIDAPDVTGKSTGESWTVIDLGGMGLKTLGSELFRYTFLTTLYINHNNLTHLSPDICKLRFLTCLDVSGNKLSSLPAEIGILTSLKELYLFDNNLVMLPPEMGTLHQLDKLGIEGNPIGESMKSLLQKNGTAALIAYLRDSCPVPLPPPERDWIVLDDDASSTDPADTFTVFCYNVLCEKYATSSLYGYTPSWALAWDYRKELISQEILSYGADIICLQEVDAEQYEEYFMEQLAPAEYEGIYHQKTRAKTMSDKDRRKVDGCAIFYKRNKFTLIESQNIEFNQIALQREDFRKTEDMFNRVMTKDEIAVFALLENKETATRLIVANTHIQWDVQYKDVKLVQVAIMMDELAKTAAAFARYPPKLTTGNQKPAPRYDDGNKIPHLICGDYNSVPTSGVYEYLSRGVITKDHEDFMKHIYGAYTSEGLSHKLPLKSAYSNLGELSFTNYTPGFQGPLDYIWYTTNSLTVTGVLGEVDKNYLSKVVGFPNAHFPSDHICILSEFRVKPPKETPTQVPQFNTAKKPQKRGA